MIRYNRKDKCSEVYHLGDLVGMFFLDKVKWVFIPDIRYGKIFHETIIEIEEFLRLGEKLWLSDTIIRLLNERRIAELNQLWISDTFTNMYQNDKVGLYDFIEELREGL